MIAIWIFRNKYKSFEKKNSSKVFQNLKMTVLLKDPKGALWCSMTSKKHLCGLIKNSEAFKWLLSERRSNWEFNQINLWLFDSRFFSNCQLPIFPRLQKAFEL